MNDTIKIRVWVATNKVDSKCETTEEFDREEWTDMSEDDREELVQGIMLDMTYRGWEEV